MGQHKQSLNLGGSTSGMVHEVSLDHPKGLLEGAAPEQNLKRAPYCQAMSTGLPAGKLMRSLVTTEGFCGLRMLPTAL